MSVAMLGGVEIVDYLATMDRSGIDRLPLIAMRCGDVKVNGSFERPYEGVTEVCAAHPVRFSVLSGTRTALAAAFRS